MKIGAFAKKFDVKKSTVRYYTEKNLLVPNRKGTYPDFDETCEEDMKLIMAYRELNLSVEEIAEFLINKRLNQGYNKFYIANLKKSLIEKKSELLNLIRKSEEKVKGIDHYMNTLEDLDDKYDVKKGMTMKMLGHLKCPDCNQSFAMTHAEIYNGLIRSGLLSCDCGILFRLEDGLIIQSSYEHDPKRVGGLLSRNIKNQYYSELKLATSELNKVFSKWDHNKGILFLEAGIEILTFNLEQYLSMDGRYYFINRNKKLLSYLRDKLSSHESFDAFVFIVMQDQIPLYDVKYLVDLDGSANDQIYLSNKPLTSTLSKSLKGLEEIMYLGFGYYPIDEKYLKSYKSIFLEHIVYEKSVTGADVIMEVGRENIDIKLYHYTRA